MNFQKIFLKKEYFLLLVIVVFFLATRLYKIGSIPSSVYWDEASIGYNAYSISIDGKDEWGDFLPIHFRAFGEFKLPVFIYSVVPFVKLFGLNATTIRIPAVFYSLLSIILIYLITIKVNNHKPTALLASLVFSVSPWYFIFSRTGYEATAGVFFMLLTIYLYFLSDKHKRLIIFSFVSLIISIYSYNSFRIIAPFFIIFVVGKYTLSINRKNLPEIKRSLVWLVLANVLFVISLFPIYRLYKYDYGGTRLGTVSIKSGSTSGWETAQRFVKNYLSEFSYDFLIRSGDTIPRSQIPGNGEVYIITVPLLLLGIFYSLKSKRYELLLFLILLLASPVPSAITKEAPHSLRSIFMSPMISIVSALGCYYLLYLLKLHKKNTFFLIVASAYVLLFLNYFTKFIRSYNLVTQKDWQYGYKEVFTKYKDEITKSDRVIVSSEYGQPYIFALFYDKVSPLDYRMSVQHAPPDKWGFLSVMGFDKYIFKQIDREDVQKGSIVFSDYMIESEEKYLIGEIKYSDNNIVLWVYEK